MVKKQRAPLGENPTEAESGKYLQDSTPDELAEIQLRWAKTDLGKGEDGKICCALLIQRVAGRQENAQGMVSATMGEFCRAPTIVRDIHLDALSYLQECGCCGDNGTELRSCSACYLVKYCGRQCQVRDWKARHKLVCKGLQTNGPGSPLDFTAFDWRVALKQKLESGASEEELCGKGILWALRGRTIEEVKWGIVDKDRQAIPSGVEVGLHGGKELHEIAKVTGPKTVEQVMDVVLRVIRRESLHKTYSEADLRLRSTCRDCPYNAFVGFQNTGFHGGLHTYRTLWSINMALDFVPERDINRAVDY